MQRIRLLKTLYLRNAGHSWLNHSYKPEVPNIFLSYAPKTPHKTFNANRWTVPTTLDATDMHRPLWNCAHNRVFMWICKTPRRRNHSPVFFRLGKLFADDALPITANDVTQFFSRPLLLNLIKRRFGSLATLPG